MKLKAFISQPMKGKTDEEIKKERNKIKEYLENQGFEVIDTLFDFENKPPVYYLAKSIEAMSEANLVIFANGWAEARGCTIEYEVAKAYGKEILILSDMSK